MTAFSYSLFAKGGPVTWLLLVLGLVALGQVRDDAEPREELPALAPHDPEAQPEVQRPAAGHPVVGALEGALALGERGLERGLDARAAQQVREVADLWFHTLVLLSFHGLGPDDVLAELRRREGISGIDEKAARQHD